MRIRVHGLCVQLSGRDVIRDLDMEVAAGEVVGVVGPNGSGKSSLLRSIYRALRPVTGVVDVGGDDVWRLAPRAAARRTAAVVQESTGDFDLTVDEVVALGRTPHKGPLATTNDTDRRVCRSALERVDMAGLADRPFGTLSGGEKQRIRLARALAQESSVLVLDEPTNHLDVRHQLDLLDLVHDLGLTTLVALHDLTLAARSCDRVLVLSGGRVTAAGPPLDVLTEDLVREVFGVTLVRFRDPATGRLHLGVDRLRGPDRAPVRVGAVAMPAGSARDARS
ncbi:MAG: ABC transporter ATP-binding protein [Kineosporiaceae bacterium]